MMVHVLSDDDAVRYSLDVLLQANDLPVRTYAAPDDLIQEVAPKPSGCVLLDVGPKSANPVELSHRLRAFVLAQRAEILERDGFRDNRGQQARSAAHPVREPLGARTMRRAAGRPPE